MALIIRMDAAQAESGGDAHFIGINSAVFAAFDRKKAEERGQQKKESRLELLIKNWRRPTFPHMNRAGGSVSRSPMNFPFIG